MMFDSIRDFFSSRISLEDHREPTEHGLRMAAAALLLEVSRADFKIQGDELKVIADALREHFDFDEEETRDLLQLALEQEDEAVSLHPFLRLINEHFTPEQKRRMIEDSWRVAYADRRLDKYEEAQIRKMADLLYVPHKDFIRTKLRVQESQRTADGD
jgi:uncharacterized tellurite resistance protein B-like protein